ncbi:UvrB/UvrC motif-containing protein [Bacillus sp. DTU_2020_1000418_1_SI_GHA_SEK_038]|uniref:UvrB/UvrC motif-containing protein n=1 Tax=Bacillus sp. DTU_2020_1000418_1_SI_GHA_SEK_038 TaxID=3077585 RepID=UPI0028EE5958|nr:UvrB/UvrC motif-containing protein [Bacillus sp. DTU_2020_1000418_1_SI_GHA_SEK_038]WNS75579.1 UvrB/UvrC motif-containing protein [Bacillus sp. DTU_2020_1000418_1_SI_GHA_SEK_038]
MICQECNQRPATLHFTKIVNGEKAEYHLCEKCAQEKGDMFMLSGAPGFSIHNLLAGLLNMDTTFQKTKEDPFKPEEILQCEQCSMTFQQFIKVGRFGCANCYQAFGDQLEPILRRLHSGNSVHNGKIPARIGGSIHLRKSIIELKQSLKDSISKEEFERAAQIRDEIRLLESQLNSSHEGGK